MVFSLKLTINVIYSSTINDNLFGSVAIMSSGKLNCPIAYNISSLKIEFDIKSRGRVVKINPRENIYYINYDDKIKTILPCTASISHFSKCNNGVEKLTFNVDFNLR